MREEEERSRSRSKSPQVRRPRPHAGAGSFLYGEERRRKLQGSVPLLHGPEWPRHKVKTEHKRDSRVPEGNIPAHDTRAETYSHVASTEYFVISSDDGQEGS